MGERRRSPLSLNSLLSAVEAAPPVAAVDVLAGALAEAIDAREVSFLIADFSGRSLIRLGHSGGEGALRLKGKETAERVPLVGTLQGRALASQAVEVIAEDGGARVFAPVTSRGEAVGVLELGLEEFPVEQTVADVALAAHFLAYVVIANRRYTDLFEWGSARFRCRWRRRSSIACCLVPLLARRGSSRLRPGCNRRVRSAVTRSTSRWSGTRCMCR
jgi:hypothetical protein